MAPSCNCSGSPGVPEHTTLSRRAEAWVTQSRSGGDGQPVYLLVDSTGLKLCGPGEWLAEAHGTKKRRSWKKLHLGVDAETGQILASELTGHAADDGAQVGPLLDQVAGPVASLTGDGAYDREDVYGAVAERYPEAEVVVPPRRGAVPSAAAETEPTRRDGHFALPSTAAWAVKGLRLQPSACSSHVPLNGGSGPRSVRARIAVLRPSGHRRPRPTGCWSSDARSLSALMSPDSGWDVRTAADPSTTVAPHLAGEALLAIGLGRASRGERAEVRLSPRFPAGCGGARPAHPRSSWRPLRSVARAGRERDGAMARAARHRLRGPHRQFTVVVRRHAPAKSRAPVALRAGGRATAREMVGRHRSPLRIARRLPRAAAVHLPRRRPCVARVVQTRGGDVAAFALRFTELVRGCCAAAEAGRSAARGSRGLARRARTCGVPAIEPSRPGCTDGAASGPPRRPGATARRGHITRSTVEAQITRALRLRPAPSPRLLAAESTQVRKSRRVTGA